MVKNKSTNEKKVEAEFKKIMENAAKATKQYGSTDNCSTCLAKNEVFNKIFRKDIDCFGYLDTFIYLLCITKFPTELNSEEEKVEFYKEVFIKIYEKCGLKKYPDNYNNAKSWISKKVIEEFKNIFRIAEIYKCPVINKLQEKQEGIKDYLSPDVECI